MWRIALVSSVLLTACATNSAPARHHAWDPVGYKGFAEIVDALVGPDAIDCGFLHLTPPNAVKRSTRYAAHDCVTAALHSGEPFKFCTERVPMDSNAFEVVARARDGRLWTITYDVMIDGSAPQQWNRICRSAIVDRQTLSILGSDCAEDSTAELPKP